MELHPSVLAAALLIEAAAGYPDALYAQIRHPVVWIGALIARLDHALNRESDSFAVRKAAGVLALLALLLVVGGVASAVAALCRHLPLGGLLEAALASTLLAQRSLHDHVAAVAAAFRSGGLEAAREAVAWARQESEKETEELTEKMAAAKVNVIRPDRQPFAEKAIAAVKRMESEGAWSEGLWQTIRDIK